MILQVKGTGLVIEYIPGHIAVWDGNESIESSNNPQRDAGDMLETILEERFFLCPDCDTYHPHEKEAYWGGVKICQKCFGYRGVDEKHRQ